jgi:hypothetical protein
MRINVVQGGKQQEQGNYRERFQHPETACGTHARLNFGDADIFLTAHMPTMY